MKEPPRPAWQGIPLLKQQNGRQTLPLRPRIPFERAFGVRGERFDYSETRLSANGLEKTTPKRVLLPKGAPGPASCRALSVQNPLHNPSWTPASELQKTCATTCLPRTSSHPIALYVRPSHLTCTPCTSRAPPRALRAPLASWVHQSRTFLATRRQGGRGRY